MRWVGEAEWKPHSSDQFCSSGPGQLELWTDPALCFL